MLSFPTVEPEIDAVCHQARVLASVMTDGVDAVEAAIGDAQEGADNDEVILNILSRRCEPSR